MSCCDDEGGSAAAMATCGSGSDEEENEPLLKPFNGNTFFGSPVKITEAGWKRPGHSARHV